MITLTSEQQSESKLTQWQPPSALNCILHVNDHGDIQHTEGDIVELFGLERLQNRDLSGHLRPLDDSPFKFTDWLLKCHPELQVLRAQLQNVSGEVIPVELRGSYQGNGTYLVSIRSLFKEIVDEFAAQQVCILELLANGRPEGEILTRIVLLIEKVIPQTTGSILLFDVAANCFRHGAAPNLPDEYNRRLEGMPIGPLVGSCGAALALKKRVISKSISSDLKWADYKHLILPYGFQACWSTPFFAEAGDPLGTFGIYYREQREPKPHEMAIVDAASHLAAVVVSHHRNQQHLHDALQALKQSEERLALALRGTDLGLWDWDIKTGKVVWDERWLTMLGYENQDFPHTFETWRQLLHPEDAPGAERKLAEYLASQNGLYDQEFRLRTKDGGWRWVQARGRVTERLPSGEALRMTGTHLDIHARKTAEEELQRSQRRHELVVAGSGAGLWDWNIVTGKCYFSARLRDMLGLSADELPETLDGFIGLLHPADAPLMQGALNAHLEHGETYEIEFRLRNKTGDYKWFSATGQASFDGIGKALQMAGSLIDIHERRTAEERVQENQRVLETLLSNLAGMAYRCRIDEFWTMEFVSQGCLQLTGYQPDDVLENRRISYEEITHPADRQRVRDEINTALGLGRQFDVDYRIIAANGSVRHVWERGLGIRSATGKLEFLEGFITDITDIRKSQEKIAEQAALLDRAQDAIITRDLEGKVTYWNQGATRLFGWNQAEAMGKQVLDLFFREHSTYHNTMQSLLQQGAWSGELHKFTKANKEVVVESRWTLLQDDTGNPKSILTIDTDVTEKRKIEAQFLRAQRMESIGTLAGGIAHDLNNVLAPIIMAIDLLRLSARNPEDLELLNQIDASAHRGADLVRQVLSFARGVGGRRVSINPSYLIKEVAKIVKETFPKTITIRTHRSSELGMVTGDPTQLHQVLLNLCVNARDAMPAGGTLSLLAENVEIGASMAAAMENSRTGNFVRFVVEDTGTGIATELLGKIFEPFFTTKEIGKGTGLGLSTVMAIVRSHEGFIQVESTMDQGTSFHVYLPTSSQMPTATANQSPSSIPLGNGECILIVDDEASVRSVLKNTLMAHGYHALTAENGAEALAVYEKSRDRIRAIITDMMMPVMDGPTMISALRKLGAAQPIVASSGLNESINIGRATAAGVNHFLAKPYTAETVLRIVHDAISHHPPGPNWGNSPENT